ncbi:MAG TPA: nucleotidyl transferase AbiEii/AbiGii toxin family protein [Polyangia bacterium]|nr:nucleotidyl transferase AbiEii/AbiGii toxin family protein [Polyangia bacterium]
MEPRFDRRIIGPDVLALLQACQRRVPFHLGGGAALAGAHLRHRLSADADLFLHDRGAHRDLVRALPDAAQETGVAVQLLRDAGSFVRAQVLLPAGPLELDLVHDPVPDVEPPPPPIEGIVVESLADLRANKLTCILSRSEPRDLVDLLFLSRAGFAPERDVSLAIRKDAGMDPGILAWLLREFPVTPLPVMLVPLTSDELTQFRDELAQRMKAIAVP